MGIMDVIEQTSRVMGHAVSIHSSASYISKQIKNAQPKLGNGKDKFTFRIATSAKVGQTVTAYGVAPPGVVDIYSNSGLEKTVYPDKSGEYRANLFFSNPGTYLMYASWNNQLTSPSNYVDVVPA